MYEDLINSLIEEYGDENKYIKSDKIEAILDRLDDDFTEEEIKEIMTAINKHNIVVYNHLKTLVAKSKKIEELKKNNIERNVTKETKCNTTLEYIDRPSLEEVIDISYYVEQINSILLGDDYSSDKLRKILPNAYNSDYAALIKLIYLHYKKEQIKAIKEKKDELNSDIFDLYVEEEEKLATLCSDIKEYLLYLEETPRDDIPIEEVKIVFDPDTIYSDLDQLTRETLGLLYDAIISLKRNVIKGAKAFHNDRIKKKNK